MEYLHIPRHESRVTSQLHNYPVSETGEPSQYSVSEPGERASAQYPVPGSEPAHESVETATLSRKELYGLRRQNKKDTAEKAERLNINAVDEANCKSLSAACFINLTHALVQEAVDDWFANKRPQQFPTILLKVLGRLDNERKGWLRANPDVGSEVIVEAWHSPKPNECIYATAQLIPRFLIFGQADGHERSTLQKY